MTTNEPREPAFQSNFPLVMPSPIGIKCITSDRKKETRGVYNRQRVYVTGTEGGGKSENIIRETMVFSNVGPVRRSGPTIGRCFTPCMHVGVHTWYRSASVWPCVHAPCHRVCSQREKRGYYTLGCMQATPRPEGLEVILSPFFPFCLP